MLAMARRVGESLWIGEDIRVTVIDIRNGVFSIGIEAPRHINIQRQEVFDARQLERSNPEQVTDAIENACAAFIAKTGLNPSSVYLGKAELYGLGRGQERQPQVILGLPIFEVVAKSHLAVA